MKSFNEYTSLLCLILFISYCLANDNILTIGNKIIEITNINKYQDSEFEHTPAQFTNSLFLDAENKFFVQWNMNITHVTFEVQVETLGWMGLGLSTNGGMTNSDMVVMWIENGELHLEDRFARGFFEPDIDTQQDWIPLWGFENETHTTVGFARQLDTCDREMDRKITADTVNLLYAYHSKDPSNGQLMQHEQRGFKSLPLIGVPNFEEPKFTKKLPLRANKYELPFKNGTTYRCFLQKLTDIDKDYYMTGNIAFITPGNENVVHHMVVHLCNTHFNNPNEITDFFCYGSSEASPIMTQCFGEFLTVWGLGTNGFTFPKNIGYPMKKRLRDRWILLEIHYNDAHNTKGIIDSSGIDLYLLDEKMEIEAGSIFMGFTEFTWSLLIPPGVKKFSSTSFCSKDCLDKMQIPDEGLTIFGYFMHTHKAGRKVKLSIIRDGQEMQPVMIEENFNFEYQVIRKLLKPIKMFKGDYLVLECTYSTEDKNYFTTSGYSTKEEMCTGFIYYYPKGILNVCGSMPDYQDLVYSFGLNEKLYFTPFQELVNFNTPFSTKIKQDVVKLLESKDWTDENEVMNFHNIYRKVKYQQFCVYKDTMLYTEYTSFPKFKPFSSPPDVCI